MTLQTCLIPNRHNIVGRGLIDEVIQPVAEQQIGVTAPGNHGILGIVIIGEIVVGYMNGQTQILVPDVLPIQRIRVILRVARDKNLPPFIEPTYKMDVSTAHYYIAEKDKYMADIKFEKRGTNWFTFGIVVVCCLVLMVVTLYLLPDIFQYMDNFVGMFRAAGGNGNILQ